MDVKAVSLDDYFADKPVSFVKIDVQGAEGGVLAGMKKLLQRNPRVKIVSEFWPAGLKMFGTDPCEYLEALSNVGFSFFEIDDRKGVVGGPSLRNVCSPDIP